MTQATLDALHSAQVHLAEERAAVLRCDELGLTGLDLQTARREVLHYTDLLQRLLAGRQFVREFGTSALGMPGAVVELLDAGELLDTSWHNDAAPSFMSSRQEDLDEFVRLWVHPADPADREFPDVERFCVTVPRGGNQDIVLATDDWTAALATFRQTVQVETEIGAAQ